MECQEGLCGLWTLHLFHSFIVTSSTGYSGFGITHLTIKSKQERYNSDFDFEQVLENQYDGQCVPVVYT